MEWRVRVAGNYTDRQKAVILVLADRGAPLTTTEVRELVARAGINDGDFPELTSLTTSQISATCNQLERKEIVKSDGYLQTERRWAITDKGRAARDSIRGVVA